MKPIITLNHPDEVSGLTIMDDGTKAYWTEGRSSTIKVVYPNGEIRDIEQFEDDPINEILDGENFGSIRAMTEAEEIEYNVMKCNMRYLECATD